MTAFTIPLPRYQCHKQVQALKIKALVPSPRGWELHFEDERFVPILVSDEWALKHVPAVGGYFVVYDDGYQSWSPAAAFEAGYTLVEDGNDGRLVVLREDFDVGQWWVKELDAMAANGTPDQKRAVAVVRNLLGQIADGEVRPVGPATQAAREVGK